MQRRRTHHEMTSLQFELHLPVQAAPVNRAITSSALAVDSGVQPSAWQDTLVAVAAGIAIGLLL
jgi:hypothetical protein